MINEFVVNYIIENLNKDYEIASIQKDLIGQGYSIEIVTDSIKYVLLENKHKILDSVQTSNPIKKNKNYMLILIILIIIIGLSILLYLNLSSNKISEEDLHTGISFTLKENDSINFNLNKEKQKMEVNSINFNSVNLNIKNNLINIKIGDEKKLDLNNDGLYDIQIKLNNINNNILEIYLKTISKNNCQENWECSSWDSCNEEGIQTRNCTDLNDCGIIDNKPSEQQNCTYTEHCQENWECSSWDSCNEEGIQTRNCNDINSCGTIDSKPSEQQICENTNECNNDLDCDDDEISTSNHCNIINTGNYCSNFEITSCNNNDGYCPSGCYEYNDNDCTATTTGDLIINGPLQIRSINTDGYFDTYCGSSRHQFLTFTLENTMEETIEDIPFDLYVNDIKINYTEEYWVFEPIIKRYDGDNTGLNNFPPGTYDSIIEFKKSVSGRTIKIVIDPENKIIETNENNNELEFTFDNEKFDLYVESINCNSPLPFLLIEIHRDRIVEDCPTFRVKVYDDEELIYNQDFLRMEYNNLLQGTNLAPALSPGQHNLRVTIDDNNFVDETNEGNNEFIETCIVE